MKPPVSNNRGHHTCSSPTGPRGARGTSLGVHNTPGPQGRQHGGPRPRAGSTTAFEPLHLAGLGVVGSEILTPCGVPNNNSKTPPWEPLFGHSSVPWEEPWSSLHCRHRKHSKNRGRTDTAVPDFSLAGGMRWGRVLACCTRSSVTCARVCAGPAARFFWQTHGSGSESAGHTADTPPSSRAASS